MKKWYVYIITNKKNWTLYVWVTSNLEKRMYEHKNGVYEWFSKKYWLNRLVYYEESNNIESAIIREKQIKWITRARKIDLINKENSDRKDLSYGWLI